MTLGSSQVCDCLSVRLSPDDGGVARERCGAHLGEGTVVPEVALVGEAVADEAELALLGVLLDGVEGLLLGDLVRGSRSAWLAQRRG